MKVWVVTGHHGWGEGLGVDGVYASLEAAQRGVKGSYPGIVFAGDREAHRPNPGDPGDPLPPFISIDPYEVLN